MQPTPKCSRYLVMSFDMDFNGSVVTQNTGMRHGSQLSLFMIGRMSIFLYQLLTSVDKNVRTESDRQRFIHLM
jgi:hypothetical protein